MTEYSDKKRKGNIGEAFVQFILSSFCLVHKIDGSQDLGNDFFCELTKGEYPANILFYVQVKYWNKKPLDSDLKNQLEYWNASPIPVYLFWINGNNNDNLPFDVINNLNSKQKIHRLQYKRYTPITHGSTDENIKVFKSFSIDVFLRDIMVDYARCQYKKGMATVIKKQDFTEINKINIPLASNCLFLDDIIPKEYASEFINNSWTNLIATAKSLYTEYPNNIEYLHLAKSHALLAYEMINFADSKYYIFKSSIERIINDIKEKLEKIG